MSTVAAGMSYTEVLGRRNEIMKASLGIDYDAFTTSPIAVSGT